MRKLLLALIVLALSTTGCLQRMILDGTIESTRRASGAFNSLGDFEMAKGAAMAGLVQFEGMLKLAPGNDDALFMLASGYVGYAFAFCEDDMETALDAGDESLAEYHKKRAKMGYDRAVFYGLELLSHRDEKFTAARRNEQTLKAWLSANFTNKDDAAILFWTGYGWMARVNLLKDRPEYVADLFVGVDLIERALELDPALEDYGGYVALGAYHARAQIAELDEAKKLFDTAMSKTGRKSLLVHFAYARTYACVKVDRPLYEKLLNEALAADDPDPAQRLNNTIAKRRAKRYLGKMWMEDCGFDLSTPSSKH